MHGVYINCDDYIYHMFLDVLVVARISDKEIIKSPTLVNFLLPGKSISSKNNNAKYLFEFC